MSKAILTFLFAGTVAALGACGENSSSPLSQSAPGATPTPTPSAALTNTFSSIHAGIFQPKCVSCHGSAIANAGINLETYDTLQTSNAAHGGTLIVAGDPDASHIVQVLEAGIMPRGGPKLSDEEINSIRAWIQSGAANN